MAKVGAPLMSLSASRTLGKTLTFQKRPSGHAVYMYSKPGDKTNFTPSYKQRNQRGILGLLTIQWQCMTAAQKAVWNALALEKGAAGTGYSYFLKTAQTNLYLYHGLCGYWAFNNPTGATVTDLSGNGNTGTLKPTYPTNCPSRVAGQNPKFGNALSFDGVDDYVDMGLPASLNNAKIWTRELWIKRLVDSGLEEGISTTATQFNTGYILKISTSDKFQLFWQEGGSPYRGGNISSTTPIIAGLFAPWYHVAVTFDGSRFRVYVNGVLEATSDDYSTYLVANYYQIQFGRCRFSSGSSYVYNFKGFMDEARIYNRALSSMEILKHFQMFRKVPRG